MHSPASQIVRGRTLADYRGAMVDVCHLSATVVSLSQRAPADFLQTFKDLLRAERIRFESLAPTHPLHKSTVLLRSAEDARRLLCKLPGGQRTVVGD